MAGSGAGGDLEDHLEDLRHGLQQLGLTPYEARVLTTLMGAGPLNSNQLARLAGVPRSSTYQVVENLGTRGLAERVPGDGPAVWACPGRVEILERLEASLTADQEERLRQHRACSNRVAEQLERAFPGIPSVMLAYAHVLSCPTQIATRYRRLLSESETEVLVCNRPPHWAVADQADEVVAEALARGVTMRVLYQAVQVEPMEADRFRRSAVVDEAAGIASAVVDALPIKLAVIDRRVALVGMTDPRTFDGGAALAVVVEHPGFAAFQAMAFDHLWSNARPLPTLPEATDVAGGSQARA